MLYKREETPHSFVHKVHLLGKGHVESSTMGRYVWTEVGFVSQQGMDDLAQSLQHIFVDGEWIKPPPLTVHQLTEKQLQSRERSSRRATTKVRRLCKHKGLDTMLTLTYRENQNCRVRMRRDFDVFIKRMRRIVPDFQYLAVFEKQKRGAYHAHIATERILSHYLHNGTLVKSYDLIRAVWRAVVGADNGNIDVSRNKRSGRSVARLASYLSKYISKGFAEMDSDGKDSYSCSGKDLPAPLQFESLTRNIHEACADILGLLAPDLCNSVESFHGRVSAGCYFVTLSG